MGEEPEAIEERIAHTRERMSERTDALAYKADVKSRAQDAITEKRDAIRERVRGALGGASEAAPDPDQIRGRARQGAGLVRDNPLALALGAAAVGALIGLVLPRTALEDERIGDTADALKEKMAETGQEALDRGQQVARDTMHAAKESGTEHASQLAEGAQQRTQDLGPSSSGT